MLGYQLKMPTSAQNHFSTYYLNDDFVIGEIIDYQVGNGDYDKAILSVQQVVKAHKKLFVQGKMLCYIRRSDNGFSEGGVVMFQPNLKPIENKNNPGEFNAVQYWKVKGIDYFSFISEESMGEIEIVNSFSSFWSKSRAKLVNVVKDKISKENQGLVVALSLGDKSQLSQEKKNHFANAGAMHVLAVSGMHVGILLAFLQWIFFRFKPLRKRNLYLFFALIFIWAFAFLTGMSASVARAVTMFTILAIGQLLGKKFFNVQAIFASAFFLLLFNPLFLFDIGFQLSYLAVLGIALFYRPIANLFHSKYKVINYFWQGTAIGITAQIGTLPLTLYYFNQFPNYFFLTNIGLLILASVALISVVLLFMLHAIPYISDIIAYIVNFIFDTLTNFIKWINSLPGEVSTGFSPNILQVVLLFLFTVLTLFFWKNKRIKAFRFGIIILFILGTSLIFNREYNKSKEELVVLNHYQKSILLKADHQLYLIYDETSTATEKSNDYLVRGYENSVGLKAEIVSLPSESEVKIKDEIFVQSSTEGWEINYYGQRFFMANRVKKKTLEPGLTILKGAWSPYIPNTNIDLITTDKALIVRRP